LVAQETMALFLRQIAGTRVYALACLRAGLKAALVPSARRMAVFRAELLERTLAGKTVAEAEEAARQLFPRLGWIDPVIAALNDHQRAGRKVLIATGSLSVYMPTLLALKGIGFDALFSTEMETDGGLITGRMMTPSCTWDEKARRVRAWLADQQGPAWGYGNIPPDQAMLGLVDHPTVVPI
jgi:phosphoserine phosphatase